LGEAGGVAALSALFGEAAFLGEAAAAAAAASGRGDASSEERTSDDLACSGRGVPSILAIASGAPDLLEVSLPPAVFATRLVTSFSSHLKLPDLLELIQMIPVLLLDERQKRLPSGGVHLGVVALNPKVRGLLREGGREKEHLMHTFYTLLAYIAPISCTLCADNVQLSYTLLADIDIPYA
jgi:hypothetical protein